MAEIERTLGEQGQPELVPLTSISTRVHPVDWDKIRFGFLTRLFGYGGIAGLLLGLWATVFGIATVKDAEVGWLGRILLTVGLALCFASLPRLGVLAPPVLTMVGVLDGAIGLVLRIVSIPLIFFSGLGMVTNMIGIQLANAGQWIRAHRKQYGRLRHELAGSISASDFNRIVHGLLPGNQDGCWGAESDCGPFWVLGREGERLVLMSSVNSDSAHSLTRDQVQHVKLIARRRFGSPEVGQLLLAFPQEHALVFPFQLEAEGNPSHTLLIGHEAAATFARWYFPDDLEFRKLAARTSKLAIASFWLSLLGPPGLIAGIWALTRIQKSKGWLKGQNWAWGAIAVGGLFTAVFAGLLLLGPPRGGR